MNEILVQFLMENFNLNFDKAVVINTNQQEWMNSPKAGVKRIPLERESAESGHVTSIVRYGENTHFSPHSHPAGEEIFVLEGVFSDEYGDYPAGSYIRNPAGSSHSPFSKDGCKIFVKLNQFAPNDSKQVHINTNEEKWLPGHGGLMVYPLHEYMGQGTALVKWPAGERFIPHSHFGGEEIYVISGEFIDEHGRYPAGTWIRSPHLSQHHPWVEEETIILVKTGHLPLN